MYFIREAMIPVFGMVFAGTFLYATHGLPPESTIFPKTVFAIMGILGLLIILPNIFEGPKEAYERAPAKTYMIAALTIAFVVVFPFVGFVPSAIIFIIAGMLVLGQSLLLSVVSSFLFTAALYGLFVGLLDLRL